MNGLDLLMDLIRDPYLIILPHIPFCIPPGFFW